MRKARVFKLGHEAIDKEHEALFHQSEQLSSLIANKTEDQTILRLLDGLIEKSVAHNFNEEYLMYNLDYENKEQHILEHRIIVQEMLKIRERIQQEIIRQQTDMTRMLKHWQEHMFVYDKDFVDLLNDSETDKS